MSPRGHSDEERELNRKVGARIRARRVELGFSGPRAFALSIGEDTRFAEYLSAVELGTFAPRFSFLLKVAAALDTTTAHFLGDASDDANWTAGYRQALLDAQVAIGHLRERSAEEASTVPSGT
jgi:transcriptional regulator with XRE-family HTH domain